MQIAHLEYQLVESVPTQRSLLIRIGAMDVQLCMDRIAAELRKDLPAPGFRKGKAPLFLIRKHYSGRIAARALDDLKRSALEQVMPQLRAEDKPFLPPELVDREKLRLHYGEPLQFALRYLIDPAASGTSQN